MGRWILGVAAILYGSGPAEAFCPWGNYIPQTFSDMADESEAVLLVEFLGATRPADENDTGTSTVLVLRSLDPLDREFEATVGSHLNLPFLVDAVPHDLLIIVASRTDDGELDWSFGTENALRVFDYLKRMPPGADRIERDHQRLTYFLRYVHDADERVALDAYLELSRIELSDLAEFGGGISRDWLRRQLARDDLSTEARAIDLRLLGFCGIGEDAQYLQAWTQTPAIDSESGFQEGWSEAVTSYLLLTGTAALRDLSNRYCRSPGEHFAEQYALLQSVSELHDEFPDLFDHATMRQALAAMLTTVEMQDLVIFRLREWRDWALQDEIIAIGSTTEDRVVARAVASYLRERRADNTSGSDVKQIQAADEALESLQLRFPKMRSELFAVELSMEEIRANALINSEVEVSTIPEVWEKIWFLDQP